jgi:hypothetical protein
MEFFSDALCLVTWIGGPVLALLMADFCNPLVLFGIIWLSFWKKSVNACRFFAYTGFSGGKHYADF